MNKKDRETIFNKYGGRCAYCGCELEKGWHVDEIKPCVRKYKYVEGHWIVDGVKIYDRWYCNRMKFTEQDYADKGIKWVDKKLVPDGYEYPERLHIDNQHPSCGSCNRQKHSNSLEGFRKSIAQFVNSLNSYHNQYKFAKRYGLVVETNKPVVFYFEMLNVKTDDEPEADVWQGAI